MILRRNNYKGMSQISLLIALSLFGGIFLSVNQWASYQRSSAAEIYQRFQAVQIAENQKQRQFLGLACQSAVRQNRLEFRIRCLDDKVIITYPRGEINL